jgi:hypothetical protein
MYLPIGRELFFGETEYKFHIPEKGNAFHGISLKYPSKAS